MVGKQLYPLRKKGLAMGTFNAFTCIRVKLCWANLEVCSDLHHTIPHSVVCKGAHKGDFMGMVLGHSRARDLVSVFSYMQVLF